MIRKADFIIREITGINVMVPVGATTQKFNGMIATTQTGAFIWNHIEEVNSAQEMADLIVEEFDVSYEQALKDVQGVFDNFTKAGWIE